MVNFTRNPGPLRVISALRPRFVVAWVACSVFLCALTAGAATFNASLDRDTITLGESATLALACSDGQPAVDPAPSEVPNLQITYIGPSSHVSFINGQVSSSITYNFSVTPRQPGDYTIPSVTAEIGGQRFTTQPLHLRVLKASAPPAAALNSGSQLAFMRLVLPKKVAYAGEALTAQLQLYLSRRVQNIQGFQVTAFPADGFNVGKMVQGQTRQTQIGNTIYSVIPLTYALTAIKAGSYTLGPVTASAVLEIPSANRRRDPLFEQFGIRDFFGQTERRRVPLATESLPVTLMPVPRDNAPTNFTGAVGTFSMNVTAGPTNLTEGDPITIKIQISGRGAIEALNLPDLTWPNFKTLSQDSKVNTSDQLGLQGAKTFERIVSPASSAVKAIPPITFSFFDPEQKTFRTLQQPALPLVVRPGGAVPVPSVAAAPRSRQDTPPPTRDILPNKQRLGVLSQIQPPLLQQPWFLALQGAPVLAFISALFWRRRVDTLANNPRLRRRRQVAQILAEGVAELRQLAAANNSDAFFATVFRLLQEQLGERLDLPASAITEAVVEERLRPRGVSQSTLAPLEQIFAACNQARYAPVKSSQQLAALVPQVEAVLGELGRLEL